jgi:hypothetical protein
MHCIEVAGWALAIAVLEGMMLLGVLLDWRVEGPKDVERATDLTP